MGEGLVVASFDFFAYFAAFLRALSGQSLLIRDKNKTL
jgi:hypothetical protein